MWGLVLREQRASWSRRVRLLVEGRDLVKLGWETVAGWGRCMGGGELRRVSLIGFTELGKARMDRVGVVCWDQKCFV